jgi:hypothetical protein
MKFDPSKTFKYYFASVFEMFLAGIIFLIFSFPGIGLIFMDHDAVFPKMFSSLREIGIIWGCVTFLIGIFLIFCGVRNAVPAGTVAYRLTHPWFLR